VILPPQGNTTSCDIRGSSPGSRELELLHPDRKLTEIHALLLTGGSAFGLAAADGVVRWLSEQGIGYQTPVARVPIVPAAVVFDLGSGASDVRPGADDGYSAAVAARSEGIETGRVGAGTGCTVGKWAGFEGRAPGGVGIGHASEQGAEVSAIAVVNAVGDVLNDDGSVLAGTKVADPRYRPLGAPELPANTVLAAVVTTAELDKRDVRFLAGRGSDGITIAVRPAHTRYDGDVVFAIAAPPSRRSAEPPPSVDLLGYLATRAVASAVRHAVTAGG
jgi:L-aminopeptidase/D-esterase-like protein